MQKDHENWLLELQRASTEGNDPAKKILSSKILSFVRTNVPLKTLTSFRVGGNADIVIEPPTEEDLLTVLNNLRENGLRPVVLGRGSNVVASDEGFRGILLHLSDTMNDIAIAGKDNSNADGSENADKTVLVEAHAGASLAQLAMFAQKNSLSGLEFASGIPGTVGGGLFMNAGAYGGEL